MKTFVYCIALILPVWGAQALSVPNRDQTCQSVQLDAKTNVWKNYTLHVNPFYRQQVLNAAEVIKNEDLRKKALKVADVGTFFWMSVAPFFSLFGSTSLPLCAKKKKKHTRPATHGARNNGATLSKLDRVVQDVPCDRIVGLVLQGLQSGDCANPNARPVQLEAYKKDYVDRASPLPHLQSRILSTPRLTSGYGMLQPLQAF